MTCVSVNIIINSVVQGLRSVALEIPRSYGSLPLDRVQFTSSQRVSQISSL
jgi:hypothetical protein